MEQFILDAPAQLVEGYHSGKQLNVALEKVPTGVMLLGMGGSALSGGLVDLMRYHQRCKWPFEVVRDYHLPFDIDSGWLCLALSYSGDTEETLSAVQEAHRMSARIVTVSHGGLLKTWADSVQVPHIMIPDKPAGFQPRFALPYMFGCVTGLLENAGLLRLEMAMKDVAAWLSQEDLRHLGQQIARRIGNRIPVIYSTREYETGVARTWRIKINENVKKACLFGNFPEANHNEIIAFDQSTRDQYAFILITDDTLEDRLLKRFKVFGDLMMGYGYEVINVPMSGDIPVMRAMWSLLLADWVTLFMAQQRNIDPVEIPLIQEFKQRLRS